MNFAISHWQAVAEQRKLLPKVVCLVSLPSTNGGRAGVTTMADRDLAARLLVGGSHRLATEAEAQAFRAEQDRRTKLARTTESVRLGRIA